MTTFDVVQDLPKTYTFRNPPPSDLPTIAILAPCYGLERVSYMIPSACHRYIKLRRIPIHRLERRGTFLEQTPIIFGPSVDLVHTFNHLPLNRNFVVSAEMELPRYLGVTKKWEQKIGLQILGSHRCRGIWPLSEAAFSYIARRFSRAGYERLSEKMVVFRGAVPPSVSCKQREPVKDRGPLKLLFVGGDGLRKGLGPTLEAARIMRTGGIDVQITVVGQPGAQTYVVPGAIFPTREISECLASSDWVSHFPTLPNVRVRNLMETHDIFVLPTLDESLGWVFAEAAMSGLPSVTTNIFAIPELVLDGLTGWTIKLALDEDRRWIHIGDRGGRDALVDTQRYICGELIRIIAGLFERRPAISEYGERASDHINALYNLEVARLGLEKLYGSAISRT